MQKHPTLKERIKILREFYDSLTQYLDNEGSPAEMQQCKSLINRNLAAAKELVTDAGTMSTMTLSPPAAVGGPIARGINPFDMIFIDWYGSSLIPHVKDMVEQAIGAYEHMEKYPDLLKSQSREAIDIESSIERALRPAFRGSPPNNETEVQNAVENILNALGVEFTRDKDIASVGPRGFKPDFVVDSMSLAIEVKLASKTHSAGQVQEEIAADVTAYKTKWKRLLIVIYDNGAIADPYQMRRDNVKHFGVSIVIVKH
jgi:hypothetical protein